MQFGQAPCQLVRCKWIGDGTAPGQRHRRELDAAVANLSQPVQTRASAGLRLAPGGGRDGDGSQLPPRPGTPAIL